MSSQSVRKPGRLSLCERSVPRAFSTLVATCAVAYVVFADYFGLEALVRSRRFEVPRSVRLEGGIGSVTRPTVLDRYISAMTDSNEYRDSDFSFTAEIQQALYNHQHPKSCESASFLIYYV
jgi:hypothetical protein